MNTEELKYYVRFVAFFVTLRLFSFNEFAADDMLGKLARWLRMMGFDVTWSNQVANDEIVRLSKL